MKSDTVPKPPDWLPETARSYTRISQLWQVPVFLFGVAAVLSVLAGAAFRQTQRYHEFEARYVRLLEAIRGQKASDPDLEAQVSALFDLPGQTAEQTGKAHFLMGILALRRAEHADRELAKALLSKGRQRLEEARLLGASPDDQPWIWYLLGKAELAGGDLEKAIRYLRRALPEGTDDPAEGYHLLVEAYLRQKQPDLQSALRANDYQLRYATDERSIAEARLVRGKLLLRKGDCLAALRILDSLPKSAPGHLRHKALVLMAECAWKERLWNKAIPLWQELLRNPSDVEGGRRRILYALGRCYLNATPPQTAKALAAWQAAERLGHDEGQAAAIEIAAHHLALDPPRFSEAKDHLDKALQGISSASEYKNRYIPLDRVKEIVSLSVELARQSEAFQTALGFVDLQARLFAISVVERNRAELHLAWAERLEQAARKQGDKENEHLLAKAKTLRRNAAESWQKLADDAEGNDKARYLRLAADNYRRAGDLGAAASLLQKYVALPLPPADLSEGWFLVAELLSAQGQPQAARQALYKCLEFPGTPAVSKARYRLALEQIELKNYDQAIAILRENIADRDGDVDQKAIEESLFKLAEVLYRRGDYSLAYNYLAKAVQEYPENPQALAAKDRLADSCRRLGNRVMEKLSAIATVAPAERQDALRKQAVWMEKAVRFYQQLSDALERKRDVNRQKGLVPPLSRQEEMLLRKAKFTAADIEFEMNNFAAAMRRYRLLAAEYRGRLEELFACQRIWLCLNALREQPEERRHALEATRIALQSVKKTLPALPDEHFKGTRPREWWQSYFNGVEQQLGQFESRSLRPPPPPPPPATSPAVPGKAPGNSPSS